MTDGCFLNWSHKLQWLTKKKLYEYKILCDKMRVVSKILNITENLEALRIVLSPVQD